MLNYKCQMLNNCKNLSVLRKTRRRCLAFRIQNSEFGHGFTLLEMLISTGIFSVVIVIAVGAMLSINQAQVKASNIQNIQDNVRFTFEFMAKEIRTGSDFLVGGCGTAGCSQLRFTRQEGTSVLYCFEDGAIKRQSPVIGDCGLGSAMTSSAVAVGKLFFYVVGQVLGPSDGQPRVTIVIEARSVSSTVRLETDFEIQTTVTARQRDL
ncbi:MAG: prepilin-type N-terminal cleavage/methylation domain-containing protein [Candidatus Sungbacteria bacterium]|nr:prepilin-type N-terminal cleavage/methylation domain-containing protein [Candidatus Sungbacteria bacterium]